MSTAVFEFQRGEKQIKQYTIEDVEISKEGVEGAIFKITGLSSEQYEVSYLDAENDVIMAAVEEDYLIAEQTMENDTITFQINLKVEESQARFRDEEEKGEEEEEIS